MNKGKGRTISFSVESEELKKALEEYAISRGHYNLAEMARLAMFEYIRRKQPKDVAAVMQKYLS